MFEQIAEKVNGYRTMKERRNDPMYIDTFMTKGNKKLTDYIDELAAVRLLYAQFNLPAKKTCPFRTPGCEKFCYAKRDERFPEPRNNRQRNYEISRGADFAERLVYTIMAEMKSNRYKNGTMVLRIHESGDFYNRFYLHSWINVIRALSGYNVIFQFYTKSFLYFLQLSDTDRADLNDAINSGRVAMSLSYDKSMNAMQYAQLLLCKKAFPGANVYAAIPEKDLENYEHDTVCDCADCAKCGHCVHTTGKTVAVAIH